MKPFRPVTSEIVQSQLRRLEPVIKNRISALTSAASTINGIHYFVFEVLPEFAFKQFPVSTATFDAAGHELDTDLTHVNVINEAQFLDPEYDYPLGRFDWLGLNTIPDYELVHDEIVDYFLRMWRELDLLDTKPVAYIGYSVFDELKEVGSPCDVRNLCTGKKESVVFTFDD